MTEPHVQVETPKLSSILAHTSVGLMFSVGYEVGLVKVMIDLCGQPKTSAEIAEVANLKERYVREWLHGMAAAGMVKISLDGKRFWLSQEDVEDWVGSQCMAMFPFILSFGQVSDKVKECFASDGPKGISYKDFERFHALMAQSTRMMFANKLISDVVPLWPKHIRDGLATGLTVLDVGCGAGLPSIILGEHFPKSEFWGLDLCQDAINQAKAGAEAKGLNNANFITSDASDIPKDWSNKFDFVTVFDAIHDSGRPDKMLSSIFRVLKPGGVLAAIDVYASSNPTKNVGNERSFYLYCASVFHCLPVSLGQPEGVGLGTCMGEELAGELLKTAGFENIVTGPAPFCAINMVMICNKP